MPLLTNNELNSSQIVACLAVLNNTGNLLSVLADSRDHDKPTEGEIALEVTLLAACDRLDTMLKESARWTLPAEDGQRHYDKIGAEQAEAAELANALQRHQVFAANFQRHVALGQFRDAVANPQPPEPIRPIKKNVKRKK